MQILKRAKNNPSQLFPSLFNHLPILFFKSMVALTPRHILSSASSTNFGKVHTARPWQTTQLTYWLFVSNGFLFLFFVFVFVFVFVVFFFVIVGQVWESKHSICTFLFSGYAFVTITCKTTFPEALSLYSDFQGYRNPLSLIVQHLTFKFNRWNIFALDVPRFNKMKCLFAFKNSQSSPILIYKDYCPWHT